MQQTLFSGVCTALVTPFINGMVNYPMMEQLLRRQIDAGIPAVVVAGTTGEAATLTDEEKLELFLRCKRYAGDHCKIIAGTGSNSTSHAVALSIAAQKACVDCLLVVSPYYNKASNEGLLAHYQSIAQSVDIPIIVYNVPSRTGLDIPVSVYRQLSCISNIAGIKEAGSDIRKITQIKRECAANLSVWTGNDDMTVPAISLGGDGVISVLSNVCPVETQAMACAALDGDFDTAAALQRQLQPLIELLFSEVNPIPVKAAMACIGYDCGDCRLPLTSLSASKLDRIKDFFQ